MRRSTTRRIMVGVCFIVSSLLAIFIAVRAETQSHPFLIVQASDYAELRSRANRSPWREMRLEALREAQNASYNASDDNGREAGFKLRDLMGYTALAYILDPENKDSHANKIKSILEVALPDLQAEHDANEDSWDTNVPLQGGLFNAILALDLIYSDLSARERSNIEIAIDKLVNNFVDNWFVGKHSVAALWAIYQGDSAKLENERREYRERWNEVTTTDGVYAPGTGYGKERISGCSREHKALGMDILEYHGDDNYYDDDKFIKLHEWLYGYSHTPDFRTMAFGDSDPENYFMGNKFTQPSPSANCSTQPYRAYKFGDKARRYVTWQMQSNHKMAAGNAATHPNGRLLTYILMGREAPNLADAEVAPSRVFPDGGAWFIERRQSREALAGALWNVKQDASHAHKETNAIFLSGYGAHLLSNAGFKGYGKELEPFSWDYIHNRAVSGNTGLIDYEFDQSQEGKPPEENDHQQKYGAGIAEWLLASTFDYAQGDSGEALPNGKHLRNFHFVHPADGKSGYWFLVDEFAGGNKLHLAFHPYARGITIVASNEEYQVEIVDYGNEKVTDIDLSIFLATKPTNVTLHNGAIAGPDIKNQYLYPTYTSESGTKQIVTVLFPANSEHPKPAFSRISGERYTGATVDQGNGVIDYILESDPNSVQSINQASLQVARSFFRLAENELRAFYAVGKSFTYGNGVDKIGFEASQNLALYIRGTEGKLVSPVAQRLTLYHPGLTAVVLNNAPVPITPTEHQITIDIPAGTSELKLVM